MQYFANSWHYDTHFVVADFKNCVIWNMKKKISIAYRLNRFSTLFIFQVRSPSIIYYYPKAKGPIFIDEFMRKHGIAERIPINFSHEPDGNGLIPIGWN